RVLVQGVVLGCSTNSPSARFCCYCKRRRMTIRSRRHWHLRASLFLAFLLFVSPLSPTIIRAQGPNALEAEENDPASALSQILRLERIDVPGGAELITVHAKLVGIDS